MAPEDRRVEELSRRLNACVKCGSCRSVCPVFRELNREPAAARGKLAILEAAKEDITTDLEPILSMCLLCGTCSAQCPNDVEAHEAIRTARSLLSSRHGLALSKRLLSRMTATGRARRDRLLRGTSSLLALLLGPDTEGRGIRLRLPFDPLDLGWLPRPAKPFFLEGPGHRRTGGADGGKARVGLFVGCAIHYLAPHVAQSVVNLLRRLGCSVAIPSQQGCCGLMAYGMGDQTHARQLAMETLEAFRGARDLDAVVVPCASCASHLKRGYPDLFRHAGGADRRAVEGFSSRVWELSEFLVSRGLHRLLADRSVPSAKGVLTYHDPCHLANHLGIRREPRILLGSLSSWEFRELEGAPSCCGMGGSFRVAHPSVSKKILRRKMESVSRTGAGVLATGCMGCWIQLREGVFTAALECEVVHPADLLWREVARADPSGEISG